MAERARKATSEGDDELKRRRRNDLLDAALDLFSSRDYYHVSIDQIARKAGVSKGTVYWYFDSKDELLIGVIEREHGRIGEQLGLVAASDSPAIEKIRALIDINSWVSAERDRLSRLVIGLLSDPSSELTQRVLERLRANIEMYCGVAADLMREASGEATFRGFSHQELALALSSCIHGLMIRLRVCPELCDPTRMSALVREIFIGPLERGPAPDSPSKEQKK